MARLSEKQSAVQALDDIARLIVERCHVLADWGGTAPYDTVMKALHRRTITRTAALSGTNPEPRTS